MALRWPKRHGLPAYLHEALPVGLLVNSGGTHRQTDRQRGYLKRLAFICKESMVKSKTDHEI